MRVLLSPSNLNINTSLKLYLYFIFGMSLEFLTQNIVTKIISCPLTLKSLLSPSFSYKLER